MTMMTECRAKAFYFRVAFLAALTLIALLAATAWAGAAEFTPGRLVVSGRAEVKAVPDMAIFQVGVDTRGETVEEARSLNAEAMEAVRKNLLDVGADPDMLQTTGFRVYPEWRYDPDTGERTLIGYRVSHSLEVTVTDLEKLGELLDAAMKGGANQISGPTFGLSDPEELEIQALSEAVAHARTKAETLARASGVFLKRITQITEQVSQPPSMPRTAFALTDAAGAAASTTISPGEVSVTATVTITYEI